MNELITAGFLKNPPMMLPRPDFAKIRALRNHITQALKQLNCPQLAMDPMMYALIKNNQLYSLPSLGIPPHNHNL
jgi:hypothetical protein